MMMFEKREFEYEKPPIFLWGNNIERRQQPSSDEQSTCGESTTSAYSTTSLLVANIEQQLSHYKEAFLGGRPKQQTTARRQKVLPNHTQQSTTTSRWNQLDWFCHRLTVDPLFASRTWLVGSAWCLLLGEPILAGVMALMAYHFVQDASRLSTIRLLTSTSFSACVSIILGVLSCCSYLIWGRQHPTISSGSHRMGEQWHVWIHLLRTSWSLYLFYSYCDFGPPKPLQAPTPCEDAGIKRIKSNNLKNISSSTNSSNQKDASLQSLQVQIKLLSTKNMERLATGLDSSVAIEICHGTEVVGTVNVSNTNTNTNNMLTWPLYAHWLDTHPTLHCRVLNDEKATVVAVPIPRIPHVKVIRWYHSSFGKGELQAEIQMLPIHYWSRIYWMIPTLLLSCLVAVLRLFKLIPV